MPALALIPHVSASLVSLCLIETYNAQRSYIPRKVTPEGRLPVLRSLGIHLESGNSPKPCPGHRWREDEKGVATEADVKKPRQRFDGNYIMSIAKAAMNFEELELMKASDDTLVRFLSPHLFSPFTVLQVSIVTSLSRLQKLHRLTFSGGINPYNNLFFPRSYNWDEYTKFNPSCGIKEKDYGKYAPENFKVAALDLANDCPTLDTVTIGNAIGDFLIKYGLSARIMWARWRSQGVEENLCLGKYNWERGMVIDCGCLRGESCWNYGRTMLSTKAY